MSHPFDPDWCMRPGVHLQELIDYNHVTVRMVAKLTRLSEQTIQGIIDGTTEIDENIANHLAAGTQPLAVSAQFWLNCERIYRDGLAKGKVDVSGDYFERG